jgi:tRNA (guanine37-N1)-methyltransferase
VNISILTLFPDLYAAFFKTSLLKHAAKKDIAVCHTVDYFTFTEPKKRIDAPTFGPGDGMLIKPVIVQKAINEQERTFGKAFKIFLSPHGKKLDQGMALELANKMQRHEHTIIATARYEGMDARVEEKYADEIISVGDVVLMGGDIPAMMLLEATLRHIPGVVGKQGSVDADSFTGPFVDYPEYTEPVEWEGMHVPDIVRSGNHGAIAQWRQEQAVKRSVLDHFSWLRTSKLSKKERRLTLDAIPNHYTALMHDSIDLPDGSVGTTSVTTIDIHDIARSGRTFGCQDFFIVTPLQDQRRIVETMLNFWQTPTGQNYNPDRYEAMSYVSVRDRLADVRKIIKDKEGVEPLLVATSARSVDNVPKISFHDQGTVWTHQRPVLFLFGTGGGMSKELLAECDYCLLPIEGLSDFNHLSVRSAVAIVLDRWLGLNQSLCS